MPWRHYTSAEVDSATAGNSVDLSDHYNQTRGTSFKTPGNVSLVRDNVTPIRVDLLTDSYIFSSFCLRKKVLSFVITNQAASH